MDSSDFAPLDLSRVADPAGPSSSNATPPPSIEGGAMDQRLPRASSESPASPMLGKRRAASISPLETVPSQEASLALAGPSSATPPSAASTPRPASPERAMQPRPVVPLPGTPATTTSAASDIEMRDAVTLPPLSAPPAMASYVVISVNGPPSVVPIPQSPISKGYGRVRKPTPGSLADRRAAVIRRRGHNPRDDIFALPEAADEEAFAPAASQHDRYLNRDITKRRRNMVDEEELVRRRLTFQEGHPLPELSMQDVSEGWDARTARSMQALKVRKDVPNKLSRRALRHLRRATSLPVTDSVAPDDQVSLGSWASGSSRCSSERNATRSKGDASARILSTRSKGKGKLSAQPDLDAAKGRGREGEVLAPATDPGSPMAGPSGLSAALGEGSGGPYRPVSIPVEVPSSFAAHSEPLPRCAIATPASLVNMYGPSSEPSATASPPTSHGSLANRRASSALTSLASSTPCTASAAPNAGLTRSGRHENVVRVTDTAPPHVQVMTRHAVGLPSTAVANGPAGEALPQASSSSTAASSSGTSSFSGRWVASPMIHVPAWVPPITQHSMNELELSEVLKNAQLRHDVVFDDGLRFRPNFDGDRGERKRMIADRFWLAVEREVTHACRCAAFVYLTKPGTAAEPTHPLGLLPCVCEGGRSTGIVSASTQGLLPLERLPSRIAALIVELRNILLSLLPPSPPSGSASHLNKLRTTPTRTHDLVNSVLDPINLITELQKGSLDLPALADFLGFILKSHCAPMRDWLVERMVGLVSLKEPECLVQSDSPQAINLEAVNGRRYVGLAGGLRLCFEVLELMKLDIANHQLRTLRPLLLETAIEFEVKQFRSLLRRIPNMNNTSRWFRAACERRAAGRHAATRQTSKDPLFDVIRDATMELVFAVEAAPTPNVFATAPIPDRGVAAGPASAATLDMSPSPSTATVPETMHMDILRLQSFHCDLTDVTITYMLLVLFQTLAGFSNLRDGDVSTMKSELWVFLGEPVLRAKPLDPKTRPGPGLKKLELPAWRRAMNDVTLHIAARAQAIKERGKMGDLLPDLRPPPAASLNTVQLWLDQHLRSHSKLFAISQSRLRQAIDAVLVHQLTMATAAEGFPTAMRTGRATSTTGPGAASLRRKPSEAASSLFRVEVPASEPTARTRKRSLVERRCSDADESRGDGSEKRTRLEDGSSLPGPVARAAAQESATAIEAILARNGLTDLSLEIHNMAARIGKLLGFHLRTFRGLYARLAHDLDLSSDLFADYPAGHADASEGAHSLSSISASPSIPSS